MPGRDDEPVGGRGASERRIVDAHAHPQVKAALRDRRNRIVAEVVPHGPHECVPAQAQLSLNAPYVAPRTRLATTSVRTGESTFPACRSSRLVK